MHGRLPPIYNKNLVLQQSWKVRSTVWNIIKAVTRQLLPLINGLCGVLHALFFYSIRATRRGSNRVSQCHRKSLSMVRLSDVSEQPEFRLSARDMLTQNIVDTSA